MKKALFSALVWICCTIAIMGLILTKGPIVGWIVVLAIAVLYFLTSVGSALVNRNGKNVPPRDRHP